MILAFGSINIDLIVPVPTLPQPGDTVLGGDYLLAPGGKGANQALAARLAGSEVLLVGAVGRDHFAEIALDQLRRSGVDLRLVRTDERPTGCAAIMVSNIGENVIAVAPGANANVRASQVPDELLCSKTILVAQMEVPIVETEAVVRRVRGHGGRCLLNLAPALPIDLELLSELDLVVANEREAAALGADLPQLGRRLRQALVVTRGARGASAFLSDGTFIEVPALPIEPVDTTGAGDAFTGVLAAAIDEGRPLAAALQLANAAGALICLAWGAQRALPDRSAIDRALEQASRQ
jgi:ribokinase